MLRITKCMTVSALVLSLGVSSAYAQATRTWISGVGDDANPCSRTAPCKTFAGAISKTAAGGEINALDPGGFGAVTITKAITLDGGGNLASILVAGGTSGIVVNAPSNAVVTLRNLAINGIAGSSAPALNGIRFLAGAMLVVEKCAIQGFNNYGIDVALGASGNLVVNNTNINYVVTGTATSPGTTPAGVKLTTTSGAVTASLDNVSIKGCVIGVDAQANSAANVSNSAILDNTGYGVTAEGGGTVNLINSVLVGNYVGVSAQTGSSVRLSNNEMYSNGTALGCGGGTLYSAGNNHKGGNAGGPVACTPTGTITLF